MALESDDEGEENVEASEEPSPPEGDADESEDEKCMIPDRINKFTFDFHKVVSQEDSDKNLVYSPYNVYMLLAMVSLGAKENTRAQINSALKWKSDETLWKALGHLRQYLASGGDDVESKLDVANNGWVDSNMNLLENFKNEMEETFGVSFQKENFGDASNALNRINQWVSNNTGERIQDLFPPNSINSMTKLVLANAIYFKGQWKMPFDEKNTQPGIFKKADGSNSTVDFMFLNEELPTGIYRNLEIVELPYGNDEKFSMVIAKPRHPDDVYRYEEKADNFVDITKLNDELDEDLVKGMVGSLKTWKLDVFIPKFAVKAGFDLTEKLKALGINDVFSEENADLSNISGERNLYVSTAQHKSFIEIDEKGTVAAGATGVGISYMSMPPQIRMNRPFLFFIMNKECYSVIFAGKVMDPAL